MRHRPPLVLESIPLLMVPSRWIMDQALIPCSFPECSGKLPSWPLIIHRFYRRRSPRFDIKPARGWKPQGLTAHLDEYSPLSPDEAGCDPSKDGPSPTGERGPLQRGYEVVHGRALEGGRVKACIVPVYHPQPPSHGLQHDVAGRQVVVGKDEVLRDGGLQTRRLVLLQRLAGSAAERDEVVPEIDDGGKQLWRCRARDSVSVVFDPKGAAQPGAQEAGRGAGHGVHAAHHAAELEGEPNP